MPDKTELERRIGVALRFIQYEIESNDRFIKKVDLGDYTSEWAKTCAGELRSTNHTLNLLRDCLEGK